MALLQPVDGKLYRVLIGDGADPEVFAEPCGINERTFSPGLVTRDTPVWDCDDSTGGTENTPTVSGSNYTLAFSGLVSLTSVAYWRGWYFTAPNEARNVRYYEPDGYYEGPAKLTAFENGATRDADATISGTLAFVGKPTFTST